MNTQHTAARKSKRTTLVGHRLVPTPAAARKFAVAALTIIPAVSQHCEPAVPPDDLCLTANDTAERNLACAPPSTRPESAAKLLDRSHLDTHALGWPCNQPLRFELSEPARITGVSLFYYNDRTLSYNGAARARIDLLRDGRTVGRTEWTDMRNSRMRLDCGSDGMIVWSARADLVAGEPATVPADELLLTVERAGSARQALLREVMIYGLPERMLHRRARPLAVTARENTCSSMSLDWEQPPAGTEYVRVRYRPRGESAWRSRCFAAAPALLYWLNPDRTYEVIAEAVGAEPAHPANPAEPVAVRLRDPLAMDRMGDAWGMNFYPLGGGVHQPRQDETANTGRMIELMRNAGVRHVRWFAASPAGARMFTRAGMSLLPFADAPQPRQFDRLRRDHGVWLAATRNEPDYGNVTATEFVRGARKQRRAAGHGGNRVLLAGPAIGGDLVGPGADYLRACYQAGLKHAVDVLDVHPYTKYTSPAPVGGVPGCPESVLPGLEQTRTVMAAFEDADRPLIASEAGHPTYRGEWFMPACSPDRQARWIVRTHLLLVASGLKRVYWYAFQDEGTDPANPEHNFGIVTWDGTPKPAYNSYSTMTRILDRAVCMGLATDVHPPVYAVRCRTDEAWVTVMWDCGGQSRVDVAPGSELARAVSLFGGEHALPNARRLTVNQSPIYLFSNHPPEFRGQERLKPTAAPQLRLRLTPSTVTTAPGQTATWEVAAASDYTCPVRLDLTCTSPWGGARAERTVTVPARGEITCSMNHPVPATAEPRMISWDTKCRFEPHEKRWPPGQAACALFFVVEAREKGKTE